MNEEKQEIIYFKKLHKDSIIPSKGSERAAGYDLFSYEDIEIAPMGKAMIHTGISVQLPKNSYGRVAPRSGLAWKKFIDVGAGVIDEDYRGEGKIFFILYSFYLVCVILFNFSNESTFFNKGDRIAQLIVEKIVPTKVVSVEECEKLCDTTRGSNGFGSSGMNGFT